MSSNAIANDSPVNLWFNLKQIVTQTASTVSSTEKYALQHTKSPCGQSVEISKENFLNSSVHSFYRTK